MKGWSAAAVTLVAASGSALAGAPCDRATPLLGPLPPALFVADGLAAGSRPGFLAVWPVVPGSKLSAELGAEVEFADQTRCVLALDGKTVTGFSVLIGPRRVTAVEAAICDEADGMCLPVRLMTDR